MHIKEKHHEASIQLTIDEQKALGSVAFVINKDRKIFRYIGKFPESLCIYTEESIINPS